METVDFYEQRACQKTINTTCCQKWKDNEFACVSMYLLAKYLIWCI